MDLTVTSRLLASRFASYEESNEDSLCSALTVFVESELGKRVTGYLSSIKDASSWEAATTPRSEIEAYFSYDDSEVVKLQTRELVAAVHALLSIFLRVNGVGPLVGYIAPSAASVEERDVVARTLHQDIQPQEPTPWERKVAFWKSFPLGHPDDRVGESSSSTCVGGAFLLRLALELTIDGESLTEALRGIPYLWAAVQLAVCSLARCSSATAVDYMCRITVMGDVAFLWQQCLEGGKTAISATLMEWAVSRVARLLTLGSVLRTAVELFECPEPSVAPKVSGSDPFISDALHITALDASRYCEELSVVERFYLLVQLSVRLSYFGKPEIGYKVLENEASVLADCRFEFSSVLGKRREGQAVSVPQLALSVDVLNDRASETHASFGVCGQAKGVDSESRCEVASLAEELLVADSASSTEKTGVTTVELTDLDPTTDILAYPKFDAMKNASEEQKFTSALTTEQLVLFQALSYAIYRQAPVGDRLAMEQLRAVVERCLVAAPPSCNVSLYSIMLWFRCQTEFERSKTHDRALFQLQALADEFQSSTSVCCEKLRYILLLPYPLRHNAALELGRHMMRSGAAMSACDMFKELCMWEDAAECLIAAQRKSLALELLERRIHVHPSPRLFCCLGDIHGDPSYYEKAWEVSQHRYGRAQRSLGRYWFTRRQLAKAVVHFETAVRLNPMFEGIWFTLGCCQMNLKSLDTALESFSRVITLQPENGEAWANMAAIHCRSAHWQEAFICVQEAIKYSRDNWRIWDSYIKISAKLRYWKNSMLGVKTLLESGHRNKVPDWVFAFLADMAVEILQSPLDAKTQPESCEDGNSETAVSARQPVSHDVESICSFFDLVEKQYIADRVVVFASHARIVMELGDSTKEFALRLQQMRITIASIPDSISEDFARTHVAPRLAEMINHVQMGYRRWSITSEEASESAKRARAQELAKVFGNLLERLGHTGFQEKDVLRQIHEATRFFLDAN